MGKCVKCGKETNNIYHYYKSIYCGTRYYKVRKKLYSIHTTKNKERFEEYLCTRCILKEVRLYVLLVLFLLLLGVASCLLILKAILSGSFLLLLGAALVMSLVFPLLYAIYFDDAKVINREIKESIRKIKEDIRQTDDSGGKILVKMKEKERGEINYSNGDILYSSEGTEIAINDRHIATIDELLRDNSREAKDMLEDIGYYDSPVRH